MENNAAAGLAKPAAAPVKTIEVLIDCGIGSDDCLNRIAPGSHNGYAAAEQCLRANDPIRWRKWKKRNWK